jgi:hypothetical protein
MASAVARKRAAHFGDLITLVLYSWTPVRLAHLLGALRLAITTLSTQSQECDDAFVRSGARVLVPTRGHGVERMAPAAALECLHDALRAEHTRNELALKKLASGTRTAPASDTWADTLSNAARALFLVLFFKDGRARRLVMAPHRGHEQVWRSQPPDEERVGRFMASGAHAAADAYQHATGDASMPPNVALHTMHAFVHNLGCWWVTGSRSASEPFV